MSTKLVNKEEVLELVRKFECGMWADRDTMTESRDYADALLKSSSLEEREFATLTAITVHQNTMAKILIKMIEELE